MANIWASYSLWACASMCFRAVDLAPRVLARRAQCLHVSVHWRESESCPQFTHDGFVGFGHCWWHDRKTPVGLDVVVPWLEWDAEVDFVVAADVGVVPGAVLEVESVDEFEPVAEVSDSLGGLVVWLTSI